MLGVSGAINWRNAPDGAPGKEWVIDPQTFNQLTSRLEQPVANLPNNGVWDPTQAAIDIPLPRVGILYELTISLTATVTYTPGTGGITMGWGWPWQALGAAKLVAGGESAFQAGWGADYRTRVERLYRVPGSSAGPATLSSGANSFQAVWVIPIAHDLRTGLGALYRQNGSNFLVLHIDPPPLSDLYTLTGNATVVWSAQKLTVEETYMTPEYNEKGQLVLPDISQVFMSTFDDYYFSNSGTVSHPVPRYPGRLLCMEHVANQGNGTVIANTTPTQYRFKFGDNQNPIAISPQKIVDKNKRDYNTDLGFGSHGYIALDGEVDQASRDIWIPEGMTEQRFEFDLASSPQANSKSHLWFELLVPAF